MDRQLSRRVLTAAIAACVVALAAACSTSPASTPVSVTADPTTVAGSPADDGPSGARDVRPRSTRKVTATDGGEIDQLAADSVADIEEFWGTAFPDAFGGPFESAAELISWDSTSDAESEFCGRSSKHKYNASFCTDNTIGWDRGGMLKDLRAVHGDIAIAAVLAHEYGHSTHYQAETATVESPTIIKEQQADCFAGAYMRWVADGQSPRFTLSTGDGVNNVMATLIAIRDPLYTEEKAPEKGEHGSAFDRVAAFQYGFEDGPLACKDISAREIYQRRADLPRFLEDDESGEMALTENSVQQVVDALNLVAGPDDPASLSFQPSRCPDSTSKDAAIYCPSTNSIVADVPALRAMAAKPKKKFLRGLAFGDTTAFSAVMSRHVLALERERGAELEGTAAALRTACLTGTVVTAFVEPVTTSDGNTIRLSAGDLDEAVSGLLTYGVVASDVNGVTVPAGFARIEAFREGVLGDADRCYELFA